MCGIDVGYENPLFAVIEVDYGEIDERDSTLYTGKIQKWLTYYEMDLGLNHVVRQDKELLPESAHLLITGKRVNKILIQQFLECQKDQEVFWSAVKINCSTKGIKQPYKFITQNEWVHQKIKDCS